MQVHHAVVVTSFDRDNIRTAHRKAMELFAGRHLEVTKPSFRGSFGISSFMVAPDGATPGTNTYEEHQRLRERFADWLRHNAGLVDFLEVDVPCNKTHGRHTVDEYRMKDGVREVFDKLFESGVTDVDSGEALTSVLELADGDYDDVRDALQAHFNVALKVDGKWFNTLREIHALLRVALRRDQSARRRRRVRNP